MAARRVVATIVASAALVLTAWLPPAHAITGGTVDPHDHPYVVAIVANAGRPSCSGVWTRVTSSRSVVITDAHCVPAARGARVGVYFGSHWTSSARTYSGLSYRDPDYDATTHVADVAVIHLDRDPSVRPATLASPGSAAQQSRVTTVGFGLPHNGQRWKASEIVTSRSSLRLYLRRGSGNSCTGDSGGPDMVPGRSTVVALTDVGSCSRDRDTRLDTTPMRAFVSQS